MARQKPKKISKEQSVLTNSINQAEQNRLNGNINVDFNFANIMDKFSFEAKGFTATHYKKFCEAIQKISSQVWDDVHKSEKHTRIGSEYLDISLLKSQSFQNHVHEFTSKKKFLVLRYYGDLPMIGVRKGNTFVLLGLEAKYDDMYPHGKKK